MTLSKQTLGIALAGIRSSVCDYDPGDGNACPNFQAMCDAAESEIEEELNRAVDNGPRVWMSLECYEEMFKELDRLRDYDMMYGPPAGEPTGIFREKK